MPKNPHIKYLPDLPRPNPRYTPDGKNGEEFPPTGSHWGFWREEISPQGYGLGYWTWLEIPKTHRPA
jgi:hypothetical protein